MPPSMDDPRKRLQKAHDGAYRWPSDFAGFTADARIDLNGRAFTAPVTVRGRAVEIHGIADLDASASLGEELGILCGNLVPTSFDEADGRWPISFVEDPEHALGGQIVVGDPVHTRHRLRDGRIVQTRRNPPHVAVTIDVMEHAVLSDGRALVRHLLVVFQHPETRHLLGTNAYFDRYEEVGGVWLPASRQVLIVRDGDEIRREVTLRHHEAVVS